MKRLLLQVGLLAALLPGTGAAQVADSATPVLQCLRANVPTRLRVQDFELVSTDPAGAERRLRGKIYAQVEKDATGIAQVRAMLRVQSPSNLAGAAFLLREAAQVREQGMYVYLPSVRRVRRVTGEFADGALLGSDFSYNDFRQFQNAFNGLVATAEPDETIEQRPVHVLSLVPTPDAHSSYSRIRIWVDQQACVPLKAEFYQGQGVQKQLTVPTIALQQSGGIWYASEATLRDLQTGTSSRLRVQTLDTAATPGKAIFDPALFYVGGESQVPSRPNG